MGPKKVIIGPLSQNTYIKKHIFYSVAVFGCDVLEPEGGSVQPCVNV